MNNVLNLLDGGPLFRGMFNYPLLFKLIALIAYGKKIRGSRDYQENLVRERLDRRINNESQQGRCDFVDSMLKHQGDKDELSFAEMAMNSNVLVLAGSETTASLLSGIQFYLCDNPRVYQKVKADVREKFKSEEEITFASVTECEYLLAVLEEGMRMYPPAPSIFSREALDEMDIDGVKVPRGTHVGVHQLASYHSEENWTRPLEFLPERFLKEGQEGEFRDDSECPPFTLVSECSANVALDRTVFQPFSVGPRNCLGRNLALAEMRVILARMLWNFDVELCPESKRWVDQKIKTLWIKPKLMCKVKIREGSEKSEC